MLYLFICFFKMLCLANKISNFLSNRMWVLKLSSEFLGSFYVKFGVQFYPYRLRCHIYYGKCMYMKIDTLTSFYCHNSPTKKGTILINFVPNWCMKCTMHIMPNQKFDFSPKSLLFHLRVWKIIIILPRYKMTWLAVTKLPTHWQLSARCFPQF